MLYVRSINILTAALCDVPCNASFRCSVHGLHFSHFSDHQPLKFGNVIYRTRTDTDGVNWKAVIEFEFYAVLLYSNHNPNHNLEL